MAKQQAVVLIDGFNLYFGIKSLNNSKFKWLDIEKLSLNFLRTDQRLQNIFYCTARVKENPKKQKRRQMLILQYS